MSFWDALGLGAALTGGFAMANQIGQTGDDAAAQMGELAGQLKDDTKFTGYGVSTPWGTSTVGSDGSVDFGGVGQDQTMMEYYQNQMGGNNPFMNYAQQAAGNSMMGTAEREKEIYDRAMAMQQPGLDAQRASGNAAEYAAGRGGVMGSQFGGSGEDAAMARAQAGAQNQAAFQAMGQAQQEMMNQGQLANMYGGLGQQGQALGMQAYQNSFMPFQQQLAAMGVGQNNAAMAQQGQLTGAGYGAQLGLGGINAQINAQHAAGQLYGNMFGSLANFAAAGLNDPTGQSGFGGLFSGLGSMFGGGDPRMAAPGTAMAGDQLPQTPAVQTGGAYPVSQLGPGGMTGVGGTINGPAIPLAVMN